MTMITIGELSRSAGLTLRAIRYYEEIGLIASCGERKGNAALYPVETLSALRRIIVLKEAGLGLEEIKAVCLPRVLLTDHPMGRPIGPPGKSNDHRMVLEAAVDMLESARHNGTIAHFQGGYRP